MAFEKERKKEKQRKKGEAYNLKWADGCTNRCGQNLRDRKTKRERK